MLRSKKRRKFLEYDFTDYIVSIQKYTQPEKWGKEYERQFSIEEIRNNP